MSGELVTLRQALAFREQREQFPQILLEYRSPSAGVLAEPVPIVARSMLWVICSLFFVAMIPISLIPIDQVVVAQGKVISEAPTMVVQPLETGIIRSIKVRQGEVVKAGTVLAELDPTFAKADVGQLDVQVRSLTAEVARLRAEAMGASFTYDGTDQAFLTQLAIYQQRKAEFEAKMAGLQARFDAAKSDLRRAQADGEWARKRLAIAQDVEARRLELERLKVGSKLNSNKATDDRLIVEAGIADADSAANRATHELSAAGSDRDTYQQNWISEATQKFHDQADKLKDASEQLKKASLRRDLVDLRADRDGTVLSIAKLSTGSVLQPGDQFITLTPNDVPLLVEANISGQDNGFVHAGDPVILKFSTFAYQQHGTASGTVKMVSADSFTASDEGRSRYGITSVPVAQANPEPVFLSRISVDQADLRGIPGGFHLAAGMPVTADIKVGKRTILQSLLNKVLPSLKEGLREP